MEAKDRRSVWAFGMTNAEIAEKFGTDCMICSSKPTHGRRHHVDHDHNCCAGRKTCGKCVRGILCARCNHGIGLFLNDPDLLLTAARYLKSQTIGV